MPSNPLYCWVLDNIPLTVALVLADQSEKLNNFVKVSVSLSQAISFTCKILTDEFLSSGPTRTDTMKCSLSSALIFPKSCSIVQFGLFQSGSSTGHPPSDRINAFNGLSPIRRISAKIEIYEIIQGFVIFFPLLFLTSSENLRISMQLL